MKVLVCGGREFYDTEYAYDVLDMVHAEHNITLIVHGDHRGADTIADNWAKDRGIPKDPIPADWDTYKYAAGPIRNAAMLKKHPDIGLVVAFRGGAGTADMRNKAEKLKIAVLSA